MVLKYFRNNGKLTDLFPLQVLSELQDRLAPFPTGEAMAVIEQELGVPLGQVFTRLSVDPVAAASFGQVFAAYIHLLCLFFVSVRIVLFLNCRLQASFCCWMGFAVIRKGPGYSDADVTTV